MNKALVIVLIIAAALAAEKQHNLKGNNKHKQEKHLKSPTGFQSAYFEMINMGESDYHLDEKVSSKWDKENKASKKHTAVENSYFVEVEHPSSGVSDVVDLSGNVGLLEVKITDVDGNAVEYNTDSPLLEDDVKVHKDVATEKLHKDVESMKKDEQSAESMVQIDQETNGPAMIKLENDISAIIRDDQEEQAQKEAEREQALEGVESQ